MAVVGVEIRSNLLEAFLIPSNSMYPTLVKTDHVLVSKVDGNPARGDLVVVQTDNDDLYVKRVIGVGRDLVELRANEVFLNGRQLSHTPVTSQCLHEEPCALLEETIEQDTYRIAVADGEALEMSTMEQLRIPAGHVFVMGDSRDWSNDSRTHGPVRREGHWHGAVRVVAV